MPKKYVYSFRSDADGLEISVMKILPDTFPYRGILQLVHGMSEHKERYEAFMDYMAEKGFVTVIHDHRGHGGSVTEDVVQQADGIAEWYIICFQFQPCGLAGESDSR